MLLLLHCSVVMFLSDMAGKSPLYKKYVNDLFSILLLHVISFIEALIQFLEVIMPFLFSFAFRAFVFFSSPIPRDLVNYIKRDTSVLSRIGALREVMVFLISNSFFLFNCLVISSWSRLYKISDLGWETCR